MNWINHLIFSLSLMIIFLYDKVLINTIITFAIIFGLVIDFDFIIRDKIFHQKGILRTFLQEPFGILLFAIPFGFILSLIFNSFVFLLLVLIPLVSHILLDYLTYHKVYLFAPFSKKLFNVGFIIPKKNIFQFKGKFNENHFMLCNIVFLIICIFIFYN